MESTCEAVEEFVRVSLVLLASFAFVVAFSSAARRKRRQRAATTGLGGCCARYARHGCAAAECARRRLRRDLGHADSHRTAARREQERPRLGRSAVLSHASAYRRGLGRGEASEVGFSFDPSYERIVFHAIRVIRDGVARDELDLEPIRVFSEESEADERIDDGSMTALAIAPDVRPGDIIDSEVTIEGDNPVFEGRFAGSRRRDSNVWTGHPTNRHGA